MKAARVLQEGLAQSSEKVTLAYGIPGIKLACDLCGYTGGVPRSPLLPLDAASRRAVTVAINELRNGLEY
jgi:4-hydroxy-2-oxoglutarate aldolase